MSSPKIILIGAGGHALSCIDTIERHGQYQVAGLVGGGNDMVTGCLEYSIIGTDSELVRLAKIYSYALITVGQIKTSKHRIRLYDIVTKLGFTLPTIISPMAYVSSHASIGPGTIVMPGAIINAGVKIGNNCIINSAAIVEHGVSVNDHSHISTGAILNGDVCIDSGSFVGSGSIIKQGVSIGKNCLIGMGTTVRCNVLDNAVYLGSLK